MHKLLLTRTVCFLLFMAAASSYAQTKPSELMDAIRASAPSGTGNLTKFLVDVYDAELWTDAPSWSFDHPFALTLHYHINITRAALTDKTVELMNDQQPLSETQSQDYTRQFLRLFPDVQKGDEITALFVPQKGITFYRNGSATGSITDTGFAKRFIDIWLSPQTSEPDLRAHLLNLSKS